jgi:sigma-B regulation protein RsbU (phosphoserine phosphatase)
MSLKVKLILLAVFEVLITISVVGWLAFRESKSEITNLALELLKAKTDLAYLMSSRHVSEHGVPDDELKQAISRIPIARDGYVTVISNKLGPEMGTLVVHPTRVGSNLYNEQFPHIQRIIDEINRAGRIDGYEGVTRYRQHTEARGRQWEWKIGYYKYFRPYEWILLATGYEKDVYASAGAVLSSTTKAILAVLILAIVFIYFTIRRMFQPVQTLIAGTERVAKGDWDVSLNIHARDEIGQLASSFNDMVASLRRNARIWHEFNLAREMQARLLPTIQPRLPGFELAAKSIPATEVGGDFYDFIPLDDNRLAIVLGDVSGKGLTGAMVMTAAMTALRFAAEEHTSPQKVLAAANRRLLKDTQRNMFVAVFYGVLDLRKRTLCYVNAGQTTPYLKRNGEVRWLPRPDDGDRFPLGLVPRPDYRDFTLDLLPGDTVVLYTDGVVEARNGTAETYGFSRLERVVRRCNAPAADRVVEEVIGEVQLFRNQAASQDGAYTDDITVVVLRSMPASMAEVGEV